MTTEKELMEVEEDNKETTEEQEISLGAAYRALCNDESLCDVRLQGTDGVLVPANRGILAARSRVFRTLFFGNFAEAQKGEEQGVIQLGYDSKVLRSVLEYCATDQVDFLMKQEEAPAKADPTVGFLMVHEEGAPTNDESGADGKSASAGSSEEKKKSGKDKFSWYARHAFELADAANYFELPKFKKQVEKWACDKMESDPSMACFFLDGALADSLSANSISDFAWETIRNNAKALLKNDAVASVDPKVLEAILKDTEIVADEITLFLALKAWADANEDDQGRGYKRRDIAKEMVKHISLHHISPSKISAIVEPSDLVTTEQLLAAYRSQAIEANSKHSVSYNRMRHCDMSSWDEKGVQVGTQCTCRIKKQMQPGSGLWTWGITRIRRGGTFFCIGVESTSRSCAWYYDNTGCTHMCRHYPFLPVSFGTDAIFPPLQDGSTVTLTLDLTGSGMLSASVDGGKWVQLFHNMNSLLREGNGDGFHASVFYGGSGGATFCGFQAVPENTGGEP